MTSLTRRAFLRLAALIPFAPGVKPTPPPAPEPSAPPTAMSIQNYAQIVVNSPYPHAGWVLLSPGIALDTGGEAVVKLVATGTEAHDALP